MKTTKSELKDFVPGRREALLGTAALAGAAIFRMPAFANAPEIPVVAGEHTPVALPFAPGSLRGISEKLILSHHNNNYSGAVKNLNLVEKELSLTTKDTPPFVVSALRERELVFRNSKSLHEQYFANLGGDGKRTGAIDAEIVQNLGTAARFEELFKSAGLGLAGGSGWVCLNYELETGALRIVASGNHTQAQALTIPLFVMDMYEHSYQMDYGASAAKYIEAFFDNIHWGEVNARLARARKAFAAMHA